MHKDTLVLIVPGDPVKEEDGYPSRTVGSIFLSLLKGCRGPSSFHCSQLAPAPRMRAWDTDVVLCVDSSENPLGGVAGWSAETPRAESSHAAFLVEENTV